LALLTLRKETATQQEHKIFLTGHPSSFDDKAHTKQ